MNRHLLQLIIFWLFCSVLVSYAQDCTAASTEIMRNVEQVCLGTGANQICYGNHDVRAVPRVGDIVFNEPGATADVNNIRSLFLSALNTDANEWGVAQLNLTVNQGAGPQNVTMLLFGDVEVENQSQDSAGVAVTVRAENPPIYPIAPAGESTMLYRVPQGTTVRAIGRLDSGAWIRVEVPDTPYVGWITVGSLADNPDLDTLPVQSGDAPYYGAMQAFTFESGSNPDCTETTNDGLLIQTTEGVARVSFLINEVTIELTSASPNGASAFVQANPEGEGMSITVLDGTAYVQTGEDNRPVTVEAGKHTTITLTADLSPIGSPSHPEPFSSGLITAIPVVGALDRPPSGQPESDPRPSHSAAIETGNTDILMNPTPVPSGTVNNTDPTGVRATAIPGSNPTDTGSSTVLATDSPIGPVTGDGPKPAATPEPPEPVVCLNESKESCVYLTEIALAVGAVVFGIVFVVWMVVSSRRARH